MLRPFFPMLATSWYFGIFMQISQCPATQLPFEIVFTSSEDLLQKTNSEVSWGTCMVWLYVDGSIPDVLSIDFGSRPKNNLVQKRSGMLRTPSVSNKAMLLA